MASYRQFSPETTTNNLRILIVADDPLARAGLATLLADQPGCTVVGRVAEGTDLAAELDVYQPDVIVWDLGWESDLANLPDFKKPDLPVVVLLSDEIHAAEVWTAGARGLLLRDVGAERLLAAIQAAYQDLVIVDPALAPALLSTKDPNYAHPVEELSPRELEVLQLLAEGLPNKAIAHRLNISEHTVKFHVNAIMGKLGAQSRTEAAVRAARMGLILL
ncbi:LuxR C-terminal-related transcriptional regulator [Chloroflexota bacterium]